MQRKKLSQKGTRTKTTVKKQKRVAKKKSKRIKLITTGTPLDRPMFWVLMLLVAFGTLMVFSANMYTSVVEDSSLLTVIKQFGFVFVGVWMMLILSKVDYRVWNKMSFAVMGIMITVVLLLAVLLLGDKEGGARRWFTLAGITFQPSELARFTGILYMAVVVTRYPKVTRNFWFMSLYCILPIGLLCGLTVIEPSLTSAITIAVPMLGILFLAVRNLWLLVPYFVAAFGGIGAFLVADWRVERLLVFMGGGSQDYQISQSLLAIGSGGVFGKGLGNGIQKYLFLPELQNDFIFANIGEELGMLGCFFVIGLFIFIIFRGIKNAIKAPDAFGFYYTIGVMILIAFHVIVNIGVATALLPVTGMTLPFISAGGTSMLVFFAMFGPLFNVTRQVNAMSGKGELI